MIIVVKSSPKDLTVFIKWAVVSLGGSDSALPSPHRLAEKYRECLSNKEKILKEIEVKKEYLSSLQPRLNSIMQVPPATLAPRPHPPCW